MSGAGNAPQRCSGRAQALAHSQRQAAQDENRKAQPVHLVQCRRTHQQGAARGAACHAPQHRDLGSHVIGDSPRPGPAEQRGNVLDADGQPRQHRAVAHAQMHERRQDRQRQAYGNIADKREVNVSGNMPCPAPRGRPDRNRNISSRGVRHMANERDGYCLFPSSIPENRLTAPHAALALEKHTPHPVSGEALTLALN